MADEEHPGEDGSRENRPESKPLPPAFAERMWKPGESGNPGGRPKKKPLTDAYAKILNQPIPGDKEGRTFAEAIAMAMVKEATKGKVNAASELADRVEGRPMGSSTDSNTDRLQDLVRALRGE